MTGTKQRQSRQEVAKETRQRILDALQERGGSVRLEHVGQLRDALGITDVPSGIFKAAVGSLRFGSKAIVVDYIGSRVVIGLAKK